MKQIHNTKEATGLTLAMAGTIIMCLSVVQEFILGEPIYLILVKVGAVLFGVGNYLKYKGRKR